MGLLALVLFAAAPTHAASNQPPSPAPAASVASVEEAIAVLASPLRWSERSLLVRTFARWVDDDVEPHLYAIGVLARSRNPDVAPALIDALGAPTFPYRFEAGVALVKVPHPRAVEALADLSNDADEKLARMAARALGVVASELADEAAVERARLVLGELLRTAPSPALRVAALRGLVSIGSDTARRDAFEIGVADPHPLVRCGLLASSPAFLAAKQPTSISRAHVRTLLRKSLDPGAAEEPLGVLARAWHASRHYSKVAPEAERESDCLDVNEAAMRWLATIGDAQARPALERAVVSSDPELRATAIYGLARFADDAAFGRVVEALDSPLFGERLAAIEGLGDSKHPAADAKLVDVLRGGSRLDRREAAKALAGSFGASLALIDAFVDPAVEVRDEAEASLMRSDVVVRKIEDALATADVGGSEAYSEEVLTRRRQRLEDGLARWQAERDEAEVALVKGLAGEDPRLRVRAARVLSRYSSQGSFDQLVHALSHGNAPANAGAALALGLRGDRRACALLERTLGKSDTALAVASARALADIGCSESLPALRAIDRAKSTDRLTKTVGFAVARLERVPTANQGR